MGGGGGGGGGFGFRAVVDGGSTKDSGVLFQLDSDITNSDTAEVKQRQNSFGPGSYSG